MSCFCIRPFPMYYVWFHSTYILRDKSHILHLYNRLITLLHSPLDSLWSGSLPCAAPKTDYHPSRRGPPPECSLKFQVRWRRRRRMWWNHARSPHDPKHWIRLVQLIISEITDLRSIREISLLKTRTSVTRTRSFMVTLVTMVTRQTTSWRGTLTLPCWGKSTCRDLLKIGSGEFTILCFFAGSQVSLQFCVS